MMEGWITYLDIKESRVDLCDLDRMNELILVRMINERRAAEAARYREERMGKPADLPLVGNLGNGFDAPASPPPVDWNTVRRNG